jgi:hypothetical protein
LEFTLKHPINLDADLFAVYARLAGVWKPPQK